MLQGAYLLARCATQVFKAARALAPSVVLVDEAERVFAAGKRAKAAGGKAEPPSRIKKQLAAEVHLSLLFCVVLCEQCRVRTGLCACCLENCHCCPLLPWHLLQVAGLEPGDGVLLLCCSSRPDEGLLAGRLFERLVELPLPDYASRYHANDDCMPCFA